MGAVDLHGMASVTPYMKKMLDKVGVEMQIVRVGTFKSAVEPYMLEDMSDANRLQQEHYLGTIWKEMLDSIAADRKLQYDALNSLCDSVLITFDAQKLIQNKLVDKLVYQNEMEDILRARTQVKKSDDLNYVAPEDLASDLEASATGDHIAVLYAVGEIDGGSSIATTEEGIVSDKLCETIYKLKDDDNVKLAGRQRLRQRANLESHHGFQGLGQARRCIDGRLCRIGRFLYLVLRRPHLCRAHNPHRFHRHLWCHPKL